MEMITKGYQWYHDTPEQPFEFTPDSIWLINPDTKEWMIELGKSGDLWYYYETPVIFSKYLNMEKSDFESFIKIWVEDVLKTGVVSTPRRFRSSHPAVEDVLKTGVVSTCPNEAQYPLRVEDVLKTGVVSTCLYHSKHGCAVEDVLKREIVSTNACRSKNAMRVEDALKREVVSTCPLTSNERTPVEDVLKREVVSTTSMTSNSGNLLVEDVLKNGKQLK